MNPIFEMPREVRAGIRYVLTDIDDTLTNEGRLGAAAYSALERLQSAGLKVVPVTGRPAGWCDHIARMWPVDGVVGENGAFYFRYDAQSRRMIRRFLKSPDELEQDRKRLQELARTVLETVPGAGISADQHYREADLAIDFCEDVAPLPEADVARIVECFENVGAHAKVSSIHVNGWFGEWDKLSMTRILFDEAFGVDLDAVRNCVVFSGDSPNDAPMFGYFPNAVGVANVADFVDSMTALPAWITPGRGGDGFAELADALLSGRG